MVGYVILHFKNAKITEDCVGSLLEAIDVKNSHIVIVDNGSENGTFEELADRYDDTECISVVKTESNLGFAGGNNFGYQFLKKNYDCELMVICNNDLIFEQKEFESKLIELYQNDPFDVAGPDIVNLDSIHQNPHRARMLTLKEINKLNRNKRIFLAYLKVKKAIPPFRKIRVLENKYDKNSNNYSVISEYTKEVVLQGSCIIFGKKFIDEQDIAFNPGTFLYFEEDILAIVCKKHNYKVVVLNDIRVKHLEGKSTESVSQDDTNKRIFTMTHMLNSGKLYKKLLKEIQE